MMEVDIQEIGEKGKSKEMVLMYGLIKVNMMGNG